MRSWLCFVAAMTVAACLGCGRTAPNPATPAGRLELAALPGLAASPDAGLQAELALVKAQRGLPLDLAPASPGRSTGAGKPPIALKLNEAFPPLARPLVRGPLDEIYAGGELALSSIDIERGRELVRKHAAAGERFRAALPAEPGCYGARLCDGTLADLSFLEPLDLGCRLEAVAAAVKIADGEPDKAVPHIEVLLSAARILAAEPNVATRIAAANIRQSGLSVLAAMVASDACTAELHQQLFDLVSRQTTDWPPDARAWIGDRAGGLLMYELVREGHYLSLLSAGEVERLAAAQTLAPTAEAAIRRVDADERFYLQSMRQLIDACDAPYCQRREVLAAIRRDLADKESASDYPLVAATLLLADFETAQWKQAEDFARCQAWMIALGTALGHEVPQSQPPPTNPLTGSEYQIERTPLAVKVGGVLAPHDAPCIIPLPPPQQARR